MRFEIQFPLLMSYEIHILSCFTESYRMYCTVISKAQKALKLKKRLESPKTHVPDWCTYLQGIPSLLKIWQTWSYPGPTLRTTLEDTQREKRSHSRGILRHRSLVRPTMDEGKLRIETRNYKTGSSWIPPSYLQDHSVPWAKWFVRVFIVWKQMRTHDSALY